MWLCESIFPVKREKKEKKKIIKDWKNEKKINKQVGDEERLFQMDIRQMTRERECQRGRRKKN